MHTKTILGLLAVGFYTESDGMSLSAICFLLAAVFAAASIVNFVVSKYQKWR